MNSDKIKILYENSIKKSKIPNEIGISRSTFFEMMNGIGSPRVENLEKVANYFNKPISYFFDEENFNNQEYQNKIDELEKEIRALRKENEILIERIKDKEAIIKKNDKILSLIEKENSKNADEDQSIAM